jgi:hypothetical protein
VYNTSKFNQQKVVKKDLRVEIKDLNTFPNNLIVKIVSKIYDKKEKR